MMKMSNSEPRASSGQKCSIDDDDDDDDDDEVMLNVLRCRLTY